MIEEYRPAGRDKERWDRKCRQWGLHGHDRLRLITRIRGVEEHHLQKWYVSRDPATARKWMTTYHNFFVRQYIEDPIEHRKIVAERVEAHMAIEYGAQP